MRALRALAIFVTLLTTSTAAFAAGTGEVVVAGVGFPKNALVGCFACLLIRMLIWIESPNKLLAYNVIMSAIAVLGTGVYLVEYPGGLWSGFIIGLGVGSGVVGLIEFARSKVPKP